MQDLLSSLFAQQCKVCEYPVDLDRISDAKLGATLGL